MDSLFQSDEPRTRRGRFAQVAPEQGLETSTGLTYIVPDELADLRPGDRVVVPLGRGNRQVAGYVLSVSDTTDVPSSKLKSIAAREREALHLPDALIELARWIAAYYCCPLGMVFATMLPAAVKRGTGLVKRALVDLQDPIGDQSLPAIVKHHKLPPKQRAILSAAMELSALGKLPMDARTLAEAGGAKSSQPVNQLVDKGLLRRVDHTELRSAPSYDRAETQADVELNDEQQRTYDAITATLNDGFRVHVIHGVTGSGKTEVYIRAIEPVVTAGKVAVVLVPEIALTPQTVGRFLGRFERVAVLHSGLTAAQRHRQWLAIRDGWAEVVVGARSAVFAPTGNLGLIVVDEEHDNSYKQDQAPRYHGRDVAIKRGQMHDCPVVLGSATPSLESYYNATEGRARGHYHLHKLTRRVLDRPLPSVRIVDMMAQRRARVQRGDRGVHLISDVMEKGLRQTFDAGAQAILLLNRRGYANYIACPDHQCGWQMRCEFCDAAMVYHLDQRVPAGGLMRCHYCSYENRLPKLCPVCGRKVTVFGLGTQRVEQELERKFPRARLLRMDSDAMRTGRDYNDALGRFRAGEVDLLIGTQMIAKGLDFPNVRLVGVISADTALNLPDFRASERTFQLVSQVAGRGGRGDSAGTVFVQTFTPTNPVIKLAAEHDYGTFARQELEQRRRASLPPVMRMARVVCRDRDLDKCVAEADEVNAALLSENERLGTGCRILGPLVPPMSRIGGYHRMQIEIVADTAAVLQRLLGAVREAGAITSDLNMAVDVDPVSLM